MKTKARFYLALLISLHIFLLGQLRFFPYPEIFIFPYLINQKLIPYLQINDQHFPGLFFLPINFATLGLSDDIAARVWLYMIVVILHLLIFIITKSITHNIKKALLANLFFSLWHPFWGGTVLWVDSFIPLLVLPAFFLTYKYISSYTKKNMLLIVIGFLMSIAVLFKQTYFIFSLGLLGVVYFYHRKFRIFFYFMVGFVPLLFLVFFIFLI